MRNIVDLKVVEKYPASQYDFSLTPLGRDLSKSLADNSKEINALATRFALNEMKLNNWGGNELEWQQIYATVLMEKQLFVKSAFSIAEILENSRELLAGQQKMITKLGVIVSNQGEILKNQEIIITNQGLILDVTGEILENTEEILEVNYEILGRVKDIQVNVKDMKVNGIKVIADNRPPGSNFMGYLGIAGAVLGVILLLFIVLKVVKPKRKG